MRFPPRLGCLVVLATCLQLVAPHPTRATTFTLETVDSPVLVPTPPTVSLLPIQAIAIDASGNTHISYGDQVTSTIKYGVKSGGSWTIETVFTQGFDPDAFAPNVTSSLALDPSGMPHVAFNDFNTQSILYGSRVGGVWTFETAAPVRGAARLEIDTSGIPHILYFDGTNSELRYATKSGGTWSSETVTVGVAQDPSLTLDSAGNPHVTYVMSSSASGITTLYYATRAGGVWVNEPIYASPPFPFAITMSNSIKVNGAGNPCVSHQVIVSGQPRLGYSVRSGGAWSTEIVDATLGTGLDNSLQLTPAGAPRIGYHYASTGRDLRYASKAGGVWTIEVVDAPGNVGRRSRLALDAIGNPRIIYLDLTNASLKYASAEQPGGFVSGTLLASCPSAGTPLAGVTIDAFDVGSMMLTGTASTDASGNYTLGPLAPGNHNIVMVTPLGYTATPHEQVVTVVDGQIATLDFALECEAPSGDVRGVGFWKHQVGIAISGKGSAQVDASTLCGFLDLVAAHFNSNAVNPVVIYAPPASGDCDDKLLVASTLLNLQGPVGMQDRARQQLLAVLLNVASGRLGTMSVISADGATVSQAITYCDNLIDNPAGDYERAKSIAETINSGTTVASGMIPLTTAQIAYRRELALRTFRVTPNPGPGTREFRFAMGEAGPVRLNVFDASGRRIAGLLDRRMDPGQHSVPWRGVDDRGVTVGNGIYFARLETGRGARTLKVIQLSR